MKNYVKLLWPFIVLQLFAFGTVLAFCNYVYLISIPAIIYAASFIFGLTLLFLLKKHLTNSGKYVKAILIIIFLLSIGLIPIMGKDVGDKLTQQNSIQ